MSTPRIQISRQIGRYLLIPAYRIRDECTCSETCIGRSTTSSLDVVYAKKRDMSAATFCLHTCVLRLESCQWRVSFLENHREIQTSTSGVNDYYMFENEDLFSTTMQMIRCSKTIHISDHNCNILRELLGIDPHIWVLTRRMETR
eukprot:Gregarina_sp_Poly_1__3068@NODE_1863_length_3170_cov_75_754431_g1208_i0_p2_GENE_NODE_1863_length_3170_cov_75_754431_g1208_i0NODE_1863_length_3170_cov_75_754431_g1208_i0_p2_ORF_typecomplete_len145_score10_14_NODE_1863_length_3170_cov_75_754431_g1208_i0211645